MTRLRSALWLPIFDDLAEPAVVARLAAEAEEAGWHGVFVWDHLRWRAPVRQVADPWITLTAIATATERLRFGPMVTPLARRRPPKVARETATLDRLSGGRLTLGVGPRPVQRPGVPVWAAGLPGNVKPLRRAARHDGFFPVNLERPDQLADIVTTITDLRRPKTTPYDIAVALPPSADPAPYAKAGATWWLAEFPPETVSLDQVRGVLRDGPIEP
ncbi:LLM class flavin-dependent oxidoreductase [Saccharothrix deserti]|uniref:LLM class flavin-dependent oxidoreductase n=1 Tax=Saccharothrix deserti TaxID=2593674 RepID=UPI00131DDF7A|nr:LLM class flavin-dependent oxidoreductase [Saccharothrix deserti]